MADQANFSGMKFKPVTDPNVVKAVREAPSTPAYQGPEPIAPGGRNLGITGSAVAGFASDNPELMRYAASKLFPDQPIEEAAKRFGLRDGKLVYRADDGRMYYAFPQEGLESVGASIASGIGPAIPAGGGAAAGILSSPLIMTGPLGMGASMGAAGAGAAAGDIARQKIGDWLMGEAATGDIDPTSVILEGGAATFGQGIGAGINRATTRHAAEDIARMDPQAAWSMRMAKEQGIDLTPAEATGLSSLGGTQRALSGSHYTTDIMQDFYENRNKQVIDSFDAFLAGVSDAADEEDVGILARKTAQEVIGDLRVKMLANARPLYEEAYAEGDRVLWSPELERLTGAPAVQSAMRRAVNRWQDDAIADGFGAMNPGANVTPDGQIRFQRGGVPAFPNLQFWDYTKRALDRRAQAAATAGKRSEAKSLGEIARLLRTELDNLTANPENFHQSPYKVARQVYGTDAEALGTAMESVIGTLAEAGDQQVIQAARNIFNPNMRSPNMVLKVRQAIEGKNPEAWQALKRTYMESVFNSALKLTEKGDVANPAGKLFKNFSNVKVKKLLNPALNPEEREALDNLLATYRKAARWVDTNSDTAFKQKTLADMRDAARSLPAKVIKNLNPAEALRSYDDWATSRNMRRDAVNMARMITSGDPAVLNTLKELRQLKPSTARFQLMFGHLMSRAAGAGAGYLLPGRNQEPGRPGSDQAAY